jgi:hypothetical protein
MARCTLRVGQFAWWTEEGTGQRPRRRAARRGSPGGPPPRPPPAAGAGEDGAARVNGIPAIFLLLHVSAAGGVLLVERATRAPFRNARSGELAAAAAAQAGFIWARLQLARRLQDGGCCFPCTGDESTLHASREETSKQQGGVHGRDAWWLAPLKKKRKKKLSQGVVRCSVGRSRSLGVVAACYCVGPEKRLYERVVERSHRFPLSHVKIADSTPCHISAACSHGRWQ